MCDRLEIKNLYTTTYHPQCNSQAECFNRTLLASLRGYVSEHLKFWTECLGAITYAYNTQAHASTGLPPFDLVLSNPQLTMLMQNEVETGVPLPAAEYRDHFLLQLHRLQFSVQRRLAEAERRYKLAHDRQVNPAAQCQLKQGSFAYLKRP